MRRLIVAIMIVVSVLPGQFTKEGTTTAQFLKLEVGARAMGMAGAFVALADDGTALYWNPAGVAGFNSPGVALVHNRWFLDIQHDYLGLVIPMQNLGVVGVSLVMLTMDEKEITTVEQPTGTGEYYNVRDMALGLTFARQLNDRLRYGITVKYISLIAHNEQATTFAVDLGSMLTTGFYGLKIGMALTNFGGNIQYAGRDLLTNAAIHEETESNYSPDANLATEAWPLPLGIRIGIAGDFIGADGAFLQMTGSRLTYALDATHPNDAPEHVNMGFEFSQWERLYLRVGHRWNYDLDGTTYGGGLNIPLSGGAGLRFDYAYSPMGALGNVERFSLDFQF